MRAQAVIGGMFGDEGKGLMTDALASKMLREEGHCVVARFNGGAQAGHTVQLSNGMRHVFHHIGSGAFAGASTYLSRQFVAHPMLFLSERSEVASKGGNTCVSIDPRCLVSTPYDVMLNQILETSRGSGRHGSCGVGFGETIERSTHGDFIIQASDLRDASRLRRVLERIRRDYLPLRLQSLGLDKGALDDVRLTDAILERFLEDALDFSTLVPCKTPKDILGGGFVVFEGAQGLALDEDLGHFPHVTRSRTGLPHVIEVCKEAGIDALDVHYGTRAYTTRHGAGPLDFEDSAPPPGFIDETNQPNAFQGSLRFSPLQLSYMAKLVKEDIARVDMNGMRVRIGTWVSCIDQVSAMVPIAGSRSIPKMQLPAQVAQAIDGQWAWMSNGPTREHVTLASGGSETKAISGELSTTAMPS